MKTIRVDLDDYVKMMHVKHELEIEKRDIVNMSDVVKVIMIRFDAMKDGADYAEAVEISKEAKLTGGVDEPAVVDVDLDDDEDEDEPPRPKRKNASRSAKKGGPKKR